MSDQHATRGPPAIRTQVCRFSGSLIREVILRELRRSGQAFFVHNRVQTIDAMCSRLARARSRGQGHRRALKADPAQLFVSTRNLLANLGVD